MHAEKGLQLVISSDRLEVIAVLVHISIYMKISLGSLACLDTLAERDR